MAEVTKTRRRDEVLLAAIRAAVRAEIDENGYAGVSYEGIARRAQTSKPVLYRRFPSRAHMVADSFLSGIQSAPELETCGDLRSDLKRVMLMGLEQSRRMGPASFRALIGEADETLLSEIVDPYLMTVLRRFVNAARDRGQLGPGAIPDLPLLAGPSALRMHLLQHDDPLSEPFVDRVLDEVMLPLLTFHSSQAAASTVME